METVRAPSATGGVGGLRRRVSGGYHRGVPPPPILEIYVLWHPHDVLGATVAEWLFDHFHGRAYAGLAGGAVEVYSRNIGWAAAGGPPRPLPFMTALPAGLPAAEFTVVVPVVGREFCVACRDDPTWRDYVTAVADADADIGSTGGSGVAVFPLLDPDASIGGPVVDQLRRRQALPKEAATSPATLARELGQAIVQRLRRDVLGRGDTRLTVFISHTKKYTDTERDFGPRLAADVRRILDHTHLGEFFDAREIQAGDPDWARTLHEEAAHNLLLMLRTDLYATRDWTQHEVADAKQKDMPVVALHAVSSGEERGSFLMDHVPVVVCRPDDTDTAIETALNLLVDEAVKDALWDAQRVYLKGNGFDWLPTHAPEPVTLTSWLLRHRDERPDDDHVIILHPDPPLGPREQQVLVDLCHLAGFTGDVDVLTPRTFASRGGRRTR